MNFAILVMNSITILVPGLIAVWRFKEINRIYYPFIYCIWLGGVNELLSLLLIYKNYYPSVNNNIYVMAEAILLMYFLSKTRLGQVKDKYIYSAMAGITVLWLYENFVVGAITGIGNYFRIAYSFILVLLSIMVINNLITSSRKRLLTNSLFLICTGIIIYFTYKIIVEAFWIYGLNHSQRFQAVVYTILNYINHFTILIFALAILWMPRKQVFTMPL